MNKYIVRYAKEGDAKFVSHLDFLRLIQRAMRRANLPLKFSEGFNPHPCLSFAHPLGVGITGLRELFEVEMTEPCPTLSAQLAPKMPRGIRIVEAFPCEKNRFSEVARAMYVVKPTQLPTKEQLQAFLDKTEIFTEKKTKSGVKMADIRPDIFQAELQGDSLLLCLAAGSTANLKPSTFMEALSGETPDFTPGFCQYTRLCLADCAGNEL